jgi:hypothetical protein
VEIVYTHEGKAHTFCSIGCRQMERWIKKEEEEERSE